MTLQDLLWGLEGRVGRRTWWVWSVPLLLVASVCVVVLRAAISSPAPAGIVGILFARVLIAISSKRLHDQGARQWAAWVFWILTIVLIGRPDLVAAWQVRLSTPPWSGSVTDLLNWLLVLVSAGFCGWTVFRLAFVEGDMFGNRHGLPENA